MESCKYVQKMQKTGTQYIVEANCKMGIRNLEWSYVSWLTSEVNQRQNIMKYLPLQCGL